MLLTSMTGGEIIISVFVILMFGTGITIYILYQIKRAKRIKEEKNASAN